jgi:hypothetical protein
MTLKAFKVDANALEAFAELKKVFGVTTDAAAVQLALNLAQVAGEVASNKKVVTLDGAGGRQTIAAKCSPAR